MLKRRFWNFLDFCNKEKSILEADKVGSLKTIVQRARATLPEVVAEFPGSRSPTQFSHFEISAKMKRLEALKYFARYNDLPSLLDKNPIHRNALLNLACYKTLRNVQADDFDFAPAEKSDCGDGASKIISRENEEPIVERTIEQLQTDNSSTCTAARNVGSPSVTKHALSTPISDQQQSYITECTLRTPAITSKPLPPLFEALQTSNPGTQESVKDAERSSSMIFVEMDQWLKSPCERKEDCQKSSKPRATCTESKNDCRQPKCGKQREENATCGKVLRERLQNNRGQCESGRKKDCSQGGNKKGHNSGCCSGKRRYSQLSYPTNYSSFGVLNSVRDAQASDVTRRFYASCGKEEKDDSSSLCEKLKEKTCEKTQEEKNCTKGPAQCLHVKSDADKREEKISCVLSKKSSTCTREQYCTTRKEFDAKKDRPNDQPFHFRFLP
ncbi:PREDICTED: uncharacterized protein LOC106741284 [Dinoponera quadriceps]|uniref:Uncharacterized protein LOC106741284 n=1 Tax=Dinoponera quadriceps TaxID=609295 RepID=A0A6P3WR91_DINQU|nr:PREDICTED: uncharacterized protein LOC106741284 [Dinoponera quadriceps]